MPRIAAFTIALFLCKTAGAEVYGCKMPDGKNVWQDTPCQGGITLYKNTAPQQGTADYESGNDRTNTLRMQAEVDKLQLARIHNFLKDSPDLSSQETGLMQLYLKLREMGRIDEANDVAGRLEKVQKYRMDAEAAARSEAVAAARAETEARTRAEAEARAEAAYARAVRARPAWGVGGYRPLPRVAVPKPPAPPASGVLVCRNGRTCPDGAEQTDIRSSSGGRSVSKRAADMSSR